MVDERLKVQPLTRAVNVSARSNPSSVFQTLNPLLPTFIYLATFWVAAARPQGVKYKWLTIYLHFQIKVNMQMVH